MVTSIIRMVGCLPSKVVFCERSSSAKGSLLSKIVFCQRLSSVKGCLLSKVVFQESSSSIKGCFPSNAVFHQRCSSIKACLPSTVTVTVLTSMGSWFFYVIFIIEGYPLLFCMLASFGGGLYIWGCLLFFAWLWCWGRLCFFARALFVPLDVVCYVVQHLAISPTICKRHRTLELLKLLYRSYFFQDSLGKLLK